MTLQQKLYTNFNFLPFIAAFDNVKYWHNCNKKGYIYIFSYYNLIFKKENVAEMLFQKSKYEWNANERWMENKLLGQV